MKVARLWDWYAAHLDPGQYFANHSGAYILDYVRRFIQLGGRHIVDFGSGPGYLLEHLLAGPDARMTFSAIDFSEKSIEIVGHKFGSAPGFRAALFVRSLPVDLAGGSADVVLCTEVVEHLDDEQLGGTLREIHRLLQSGGHIVITTPNEEDLLANTSPCPDCGCVSHRWQHMRRWTESTLERVMLEHGFRTLHVAGTRFAPRRSRLADRARSLFRGRTTPPHLVYIGTKP